jgi:DNA repair protein RecO (recombination protein O)
VLRTRRIGEIHKGVTLLSENLGLIQAMAHGAYSERGSLKGVTDPFCLGRFYLYHDPVNSRWKITDVDVESFFGGIRENIRKVYAFSLWAETIMKSYGGDHERIYSLLACCLKALDSAPDNGVVHLVVQFIWRYLGIAGLRPGLEGCTECGAELGQSAYFAVGQAGFLCRRCAPFSAELVKPGILSYLAHTEALDIPASLRIGLEADSLYAMKLILFRLLETLTGDSFSVLSSSSGIL